MILRVADDGDAPSVGTHHVAFRDGILCVVCPFCVNVRAQDEQKLYHCWLMKDRNVINRANGRDQLGALALWQQWPSLTLELSNLSIAIDTDDEQVAKSARGFKVANMSNVQKVEATVCEDDARSSFARDSYARYQAVALKDARRGLDSLRFVVGCHV